MDKTNKIIKKNIDNEIYPLDKIICKNISQITFKDTISLIFHAIYRVAELDIHWASIYQEFKLELENQNIIGWPQLESDRNNKFHRIDLVVINEKFVETTNIFMLIFRLLSIENYKRPDVYKHKIYAYHKILWHKFESSDYGQVSSLNMYDLFTLLEKYLKYYIEIYNAKSSYEYFLAKSILNQLE